MLIKNILFIEDSIDDEEVAELSMNNATFYIDRFDAVRIVNHLIKIFNLKIGLD